MIRDELLLDAEHLIEAFNGAKTVTEAKEHYLALTKRLIPHIYTESPALGAAVKRKLRRAIDRRIARAGGAVSYCRGARGRSELEGADDCR